MPFSLPLIIWKHCVSWHRHLPCLPSSSCPAQSILERFGSAGGDNPLQKVLEFRRLPGLGAVWCGAQLGDRSRLTACGLRFASAPQCCQQGKTEEWGGAQAGGKALQSWAPGFTPQLDHRFAKSPNRISQKQEEQLFGVCTTLCCGTILFILQMRKLRLREVTSLGNKACGEEPPGSGPMPAGTKWCKHPSC